MASCPVTRFLFTVQVCLMSETPHIIQLLTNFGNCIQNLLKCWRLHFIHRMYVCLVWLTKNFHSPKLYAATDRCNGDAVWDSRDLGSWKILYRPDNQWPLRCAGQPQKKRTVAPLELSVGASRVDTCWRVALRTRDSEGFVRVIKELCKSVCFYRHTTEKRLGVIFYVGQS
jgi:hypothetical protein